MTQEELNYIKDSFSQILDDIGGNPDWYDAAKAIASDLGTIERQLEERVTKLPSNLDEAAEEYEHNLGYYECMNQWPSVAFKAGAEWMKEQEQQGAIEGIVHPDDCEIWVNLIGYGYKFNDGDKVRIIIIKED